MVFLKNGLGSLIFGLVILVAPLSAIAESAVTSDGSILDTLFEISPSGKKVICAGLIKNKYLGGRAKTVGSSKLFIPWSEDLAALKKKLKTTTKASAKTKLQKKITDTTKRMKSENKSCSYGPLGDPNPTPTPGANPTATPRATATPVASGNFDSDGNVTSQGKSKFGIPSNISANIYDGANVFNSSCTGCHVARTGYSFTFYKTVIKAAYMGSIMKSDQDVADLTAYLRRSETN